MKHPNDIVVGNPRNRAYLDATGRPLRVGDFVSWVTRQGSSVYLNFGKIKAIKDDDSPAYVGYGEYDKSDPEARAPRVVSWDYAYGLKVIPYEYDRMRDRWHLPTKWEYDSVTGKGQNVEQTEDSVRVRSINVVERVVRLDVDV